MKTRNFMTTVLMMFLSIGLASCQFGQTKDKQEQEERQQQQVEEYDHQEKQEQQRMEEEQQRMEEESTVMGAGADEQSDKEWADQQISLDDAKEIQKSLNDQGFHVGNVDGLIGPNTKEGLRNFQAQQDLTSSGELDQETIDALGVDVNLIQAQEEVGKKAQEEAQEEGNFFD
ncbi:MAG: peptidoglycan-binding domain-containing protein [Bacteriovoracaceae bacterium]